jgi:hypothetical protein
MQQVVEVSKQLAWIIARAGVRKLNPERYVIRSPSIVHKPIKPAQVDKVATDFGLQAIKIAVAKHFSGVLQRLQDRALSRTVLAIQQRDVAKVDRDRLAE